MRKISCAALALVSLAACGPTYTPPEEVKAIASRNGAEIISYEDAIIRTAFRSGSAIAELEQADCTLTYQGATSRFSAPHRIRIPIHDGPQKGLGLKCQAAIGPGLVKADRVIEPNVPVFGKASQAKRVYPEKFGVTFE